MKYDLSNELQRGNFHLRAARLMEKGCVVELKECKARSLRQNSFLHVTLGYFAAQTGNTLEYVKQYYYKRLVNPDIFRMEKDDKFLGHIEVWRSSASLLQEEMSLSIDRFRNWSASEAGIYIPSPDDARLVQLMEIEIEKYKEYL